MSNDNVYERLFKQQAVINKLVLDGKLDPHMVADYLQTIIDKPYQSGKEKSGKEKFTFFVDLGIITVPDDYDHKSHLKTFYERNSENFDYHNNQITDRKYFNPTRIFLPGEKFRVRVFRQIPPGRTTPEERMFFLYKQKVIYVGVQGTSLVFDQKRDQLPKGKWYMSLDNKNRLWKDKDGYHKVPYIDVQKGCLCWDIACFECIWLHDFALLCFYEI